MDPPDRRLARNEALFREVNETVHTLEEENGTARSLHEYFCECADVDCMIRIRLTIGEYEAARANGTRFIVACGHEALQIERVVFVCDRYLLVEKVGGGGDEAAKLDPRK